MPKSALSRLLAEKERFTVETQSLAYPVKPQQQGNIGEAAWDSDDSEEHEDAATSYRHAEQPSLHAAWLFICMTCMHAVACGRTCASGREGAAP